jgi:hypothetical protein
LFLKKLHEEVLTVDCRDFLLEDIEETMSNKSLSDLQKSKEVDKHILYAVLLHTNEDAYMELKCAERKFKHLLHKLLKDNKDAIIGMRKLLAGGSSNPEVNQELKNPPAPNETPDVPAPEENNDNSEE